MEDKLADRVLVTGATGLLGNTVVRELLARGQRVRVYGRGRPDREELAGLNVEVVTGELDDLPAIERAVAGCSAVIHSAAMIHIGYKRLDEARRANVLGSQNIAAACRGQGTRLIYISTVDTLLAAREPQQPLDELQADPENRSPLGIPKVACTYVISKQEAEEKVSQAINNGLDAVILHPGFMLGPYDWKPSSGALMTTIFKAPTVVAPRGTASVCDARDVAAAVVESIARGGTGQHYILAGENIGYPELCQRILKAMHQSKRVFRMGPVIPAAARVVDLWNTCTGSREGLFNGAAIAMGQLHHAYDSSKAARELSYTRRSLDDTLNDAWQWLNERFVGQVATGKKQKKISRN